MNLKYLTLIIVFTLVFSGCSPSKEDISFAFKNTVDSFTPYPTSTLYPTGTFYPTVSPINTSTPYPKNTTIVITVIIQEYATATYTPTRTGPPTKTSTPTPTTDPLKKDIGDGIFYVGVDIAPGFWEHVSGGNFYCNIRISDRYGNILGRRTGNPEWGFFVQERADEVLLSGCGKFRYREPY